MAWKFVHCRLRASWEATHFIVKAPSGIYSLYKIASNENTDVK
jgi:hypothetical protein